MCQTCCLGFSQHRQEGGISSSHPCERVLVMFTNSLIEAKQNGGVAQLQTTKDRWPSILLLRSLNAPYNIPPWHEIIPNQGSWRKQTSSVHQVSPAASSGTSSKQPFCHQVPLPNPKFRDSPSWVQFLSSQPVCTVCQDGWGRTVQMLFGGTFSPAIQQL